MGGRLKRVYRGGELTRLIGDGAEKYVYDTTTATILL